MYDGPDADLLDDQKEIRTRVTTTGLLTSYCNQPKPASALNAVAAFWSKARSGPQLENWEEARAHGGEPHAAARRATWLLPPLLPYTSTSRTMRLPRVAALLAGTS